MLVKNLYLYFYTFSNSNLYQMCIELIQLANCLKGEKHYQYSGN